MKKSNIISAFIALTVSALVVGGYHFSQEKSTSKAIVQVVGGNDANMLYTKIARERLHLLILRKPAQKFWTP